MASEHQGAHENPGWFVPPGESDFLAWFALALVILAIYGLITLYAAFDRWAERRAHGTPLAKTIPTLLTIALLYEIFPLGHFNILLPISAILIALMADWSRFHLGGQGEAVAESAAPADGALEAPAPELPPDPEPEPEPDPDPETDGEARKDV